jgi:NADH dehydrogenase (ubiquinone) 1 alpha subcomplex subunit 9
VYGFANNVRNFDYDDVNVWGASRIAEAVAKYDVDRFVHVSSHSVSKDSPSEFLRTKALGEEAVRSIYPETTIVRPAPCYGAEDRFLNLLASANNLFTSNSLKQKVWPVHAIDVGRALEQMMYDDGTASTTFELYGPQRYSMHEIAALVDKEIVKKRTHINIPKAIRGRIVSLLNRLVYWPIGSADEVEREFIDQFIDPEAKTFADLGIEPAQLENLTFEYLVSMLVQIMIQLTIAVAISQLRILRSSANDGEGKEGGEEIFACYRRPVTLPLSVSSLVYHT